MGITKPELVKYICRILGVGKNTGSLSKFGKEFLYF